MKHGTPVLMATGGRYAELFTLQAQAYTDQQNVEHLADTADESLPDPVQNV